MIGPDYGARTVAPALKLVVAIVDTAETSVAAIYTIYNRLMASFTKHYNS